MSAASPPGRGPATSDDEQFIPERKVQVERMQVHVYIAWTTLNTAVTKLTEWRDRLPSTHRWETVTVRDFP